MKRILLLFICFCLLFLLPLQSTVFASNTTIKNLDKANALKDFGLFYGSTNGFELDRKPTRAEAVAILVRLLGKEKEAKRTSYTFSFSDVPGWARPYVGYLVSARLSFGKSYSEFGSSDEITAREYITLILRSLGYSEAKGDFSMSTSIDKAKAINLLSDTEAADLGNRADFIRDDIVGISYNALKCHFKDSEKTLADKLVYDDKVISEELAVKNNILDLNLAKANKDGNLNGNIYTAAQVDSVYFFNPNDHFYLYKMKSDGTQILKLSELTGDYINVVGDYIYLRMIDKTDNKKKIYKLKLDGTGIEKMSDDEVEKIFVKDKWLYYINKSDCVGVENNYKLIGDLKDYKDTGNLTGKYGKLYKMRLDGTQKQKAINRDDGVLEFCIGDGYIFASEVFNGLCVIDINGSPLGTLSGDSEQSFIGSFPSDVNLELAANGSDIYYSTYLPSIISDDRSYIKTTNADESPWIFVGWQYHFYDSSKFQEIHKIEASKLKLSNGYIYFKSPNFKVEKDSQIYRIKIDGVKNNIQMLTSDKCYYFDIVGDWIYYDINHSSDNPKFYRIKVDGSSKEILEGTTWKAMK